MQSLIGKKVEQTQRFLSDGTRIPVTVVAVPKTSVMQVKTLEKEGYAAVQIGIGERKKAHQSLLGHAKKANLESSPAILKEVRISDDSTHAVGDAVSVSDVFKTGDIIKVSGVGKGKGFAGGVKRHGFRGGPRTHGQSDRERAPGSIGQTTTPGRVYRGKRMAGHMGTGNVSVTNLVVVGVNDEQVLIKGLVPGVLNSTIVIEKTGELKVPLELYQDPAEKAVEAEQDTEASSAIVEEPAVSAKQNPEETSADESVTETKEAVESQEAKNVDIEETKQEKNSDEVIDTDNATTEVKGDENS